MKYRTGSWGKVRDEDSMAALLLHRRVAELEAAALYTEKIAHLAHQRW